MKELQGLADGVGVDLKTVLLFSMEEEFSYLVSDEYRYSLPDHCSDVLINEDNKRIYFLLFYKFSSHCT